jgi:hypothetical protein
MKELVVLKEVLTLPLEHEADSIRSPSVNSDWSDYVCLSAVERSLLCLRPQVPDSALPSKFTISPNQRRMTVPQTKRRC